MGNDIIFQCMWRHSCLFNHKNLWSFFDVHLCPPTLKSAPRPMNDSNTFCKLFFFKSLLLRLQMLRVPLKKGEFYEACIAYSTSSDSLYLLFKLTIWTLRYQRKRTNCTISLDEQYFPTSLCHIEKQQFYWNWSTLLFQISSLQSPKFNINKPTQRLACVGQLLLTNGLFPKTVAASGPLPTKWCRL